MQVQHLEIPEVLLITPTVHGDSRGFFMESYHERRYAHAGLPAGFVQDNHSRSQRGVLRGLHYQLKHPQGKLVRVCSGEVFDVAVDIRRGSPWFGRWVGTVLDDRTHQQLYVPPGFAHGFRVLSESADIAYKCTAYYDPADDCGILWNDPDIGISWPLGAALLLSDKDRRHPRLADAGERLPVYEPAASGGSR
jgi:dTDP-4-dehydrorhamnose 3,5-epimerase